jgi:hypothetical protein
MNLLKPSILACCLCAPALLLQSCAAFKKTDIVNKTGPHAGSGSTDRPATDVDTSALLSMSFAEASLIAPQHIDVPHLPKVAADNIEVLRKYADGTPRKIRAKGRVFIEFEGQDHARALCDEALVDGGDVILRGRPILQRGIGTVEGLSDVTVFYMMGQNVRVIGKHRVTNLKGLAGVSPWQGGSGPATLLPPLESADVPASVRDEMRKAAEAEAQLQRSRVGLPAAFPEAGGAAAMLAPSAPQPLPVPENKPVPGKKSEPENKPTPDKKPASGKKSDPDKKPAP